MKMAYFKQKEFLTLVFCWVILVVSLAGYWVHVTDAQTRQLKLAETQIEQGLEQTVHALALQTETMMAKLQYVSRQLSSSWVHQDLEHFQAEAIEAQYSLPSGAVANVAVLDARGNLVFSSIEPQDKAPLSFEDRDHYYVHFQQPRRAPSLYISQPHVGRITGKWGVFASYPIERDGERIGVLVLAVPTEHLSQALASIYADPRDSAFILRADGRYIAHSTRAATVMGSSVPKTRDFLTRPDLESGHYQAAAVSDGIERFYSWRRVRGYPLIIGVGASQDKALHPITEAQRDSFHRNLAGTLVILLLAALLSKTWMDWLMRRQDLRIAKERLDVTLNSAHDGTWFYHCRTDQIDWSESLGRLLGIKPSTALAHSNWEALLHPDDVVPFKRALADFSQQTDQRVFSHDFRLAPLTGDTVWVAARAGVVEREPSGLPRSLAGTITDISERILASQLRHALLDQSVASIVLVDAKRRILYVNARAIETFGPLNVNDPTTDFAHVDPSHYDAFGRHYADFQHQGTTHFEHPMRDRHGQIRWFSIHGVLKDMSDPNGDVIWALFDVTDRHQADEALHIERKRLDVLLERFPGGVLMEDDQQRIIILNPVAFDWLGLSGSPEDYVGLTHAALLERIDPKQVNWLPLAPEGDKRETGTSIEVETATGNTLEIKRTEIKEDGVSFGHVWLMFDISQRKQTERDLTNLASTDALTRLPNRRSFLARLERVFAQPQQTARHGAYVMIADIDFFKRVNDTYGHPIGDVVLSDVAEMMRSQLRETDSCARLGGEEFAILLTDVSEKDALRQAERIREWIAQHPIPTPAGEISITISIGIASAWQHTWESMLEAADKALYRAKNNGRNRVELWTKPRERKSPSPSAQDGDSTSRG